MTAFFSDPRRDLSTIFSAESVSVTKTTVQEVVDTPLSNLVNQNTTMCEVISSQISEGGENANRQKILKHLMGGVQTLANVRTTINTIVSPEVAHDETPYNYHSGMSR